MGIFDALTTAVSGLGAQSYSLQNISGNIANSTTVGFKRVETSFIDLIPSTPSSTQLAGSVNAHSRNTTTLQGSISQTGIATNLALNGDGFFVVQSRTGFAGGQATFSGIDQYTRRGDFQLDNSGFLVNGANNYLEGIAVDPITGALQGSKPGVLQISTKDLPALQSSNVSYQANLPPVPGTAASQIPSAPASASLIWGGAASSLTATGQVLSGATETAFINSTVDGGAKTVYAPNGSPVNMQIRWGKVAANTWQAFYRIDSSASPVAGTPRWQQFGGSATGGNGVVGGNITFNAAGTNTTALANQVTVLSGVTIDGVQVDSAALPIRFDMSGGLTQFSGSTSSGSAAGQVGGISVTADGYTAGSFQSLSLDTGGRLVGNYTNGQIVPLAQISEAKFKNADGMVRVSGGTFQQTLDSGQPVVLSAGSELSGGAVEQSNVDIAAEFSKMIVTQQAYSSNAKVITTANTMLQDILQIIR
jgi:flagellar hook protein FlgE